MDTKEVRMYPRPLLLLLAGVQGLGGENFITYICATISTGRMLSINEMFGNMISHATSKGVRQWVLLMWRRV